MQITMQTTLELITCVRCGVAFAAPSDMLDRRRQDHESFYCPNGHNLSFPQQSDAEKAQAEAEKYKKLYQQEQRYSADAISERNAAQRSLKATKAAHTRTKNRIANGVCPCCNRTFANLSEHMHMQHPDYTEEFVSPGHP
jgi:Zn ribbon nucleic-acid-binding protein